MTVYRGIVNPGTLKWSVRHDRSKEQAPKQILGGEPFSPDSDKVWRYSDLASAAISQGDPIDSDRTQSPAQLGEPLPEGAQGVQRAPSVSERTPSPVEDQQV